MSRFEDGIFGLVPQKDWLSIPFNPIRPTDPIDAIFGSEKTDNIVTSWQSIAADMQIPAMAQFHAFDTEAGTTYRIPVDTHSIEKGFIKVKMNQSERMQELIRNGIRQDDMYRYVIEDGVRLAEQVITRSKVATNELLSTGKVTIKENDLSLTVDYGVKESQTNLSLDLSNTADVIGQIQDIIDTAKDSGVTLTGMILSRKVLTKMRKNTALQKAINGNIGAGATVKRSDFNDYLASEFGVTTIIENDQVYNANNNIIGTDGRPVVTTKRYFPDNKVTFFAASPNGRIGVGLWGDPPEALNPKIQGIGSSVSPYVYITQWTENDPAVLWTKASGLFMPVLYNPSSLYIATVANADGTDLSELSIGSLSLSPEFNPNTTSYTATTTNASNTITATPADSSASVVIKNGTSTVSNGGSATWATGTNNVAVTVGNGGKTKTYNVTVTKS